MRNIFILGILHFALLYGNVYAQDVNRLPVTQSLLGGTVRNNKTPLEFHTQNSLAAELLVSGNGFGVGCFFRRSYTQTLSGFLNFFISEATDNQEISYTDYYGNTYYPGKINRFFLLPLLVGGEYRMFSESISESFRPYINAAVGPTLIYSTPAQVEFFSSLSKGRSHYSAGGYIGIGTYWGTNTETLIGANLKYMFAPYPKGIESLENPDTNVPSRMKEFGGIYFTLTFGKSYR